MCSLGGLNLSSRRSRRGYSSQKLSGLRAFARAPCEAPRRSASRCKSNNKRSNSNCSGRSAEKVEVVRDMFGQYAASGFAQSTRVRAASHREARARWLSPVRGWMGCVGWGAAVWASVADPHEGTGRGRDGVCACGVCARGARRVMRCALRADGGRAGEARIRHGGRRGGRERRRLSIMPPPPPHTHTHTHELVPPISRAIWLASTQPLVL